MKQFYFLILLVVSFTSKAQIINFPDANFKAKLLSATPGNSSASNVVASTDFLYPGAPYLYHKIDTNNDGEIQVSEAALIQHLNVSSANISDLTGISYFTNLKTLWCGSNQLNSLGEALQISGLLNLQCYSNNLTQLDISNLINLRTLQCQINDLISLDVSVCPFLDTLRCYYNDLTILDVSMCPFLNYLDCYSNNLTYLNLKNSNTSWFLLNIYNNLNLQYVCADEQDISFVQQKIDAYNNGILNCHVNSYCSFTPNGVFYEITGSTLIDYDNNGCDLNDLEYDRLNFTINDGSNVSYSIANESGNYYMPLGNGNFTLTPNLENANYFTISPSSLVVDFPTQTSPLIQDFCVSPNGVHHDVEVTFIPTKPARPGFDANYTIIYKNKGNQVENGAITLNFNDAVLDLVSANPTFSSQATNSMTWNYTNLQPFETRTINLVLNVNSPMETPAVNIGYQLNYSATITPLTNDEFLNDNYSSLKQIVVGSYDPNDKTCIEGTTVGPDMIGQYVHYVIRFENTGTFAAENVVVKDMIDLTKFDVATLIPLHSSHEFVTRIVGNKVEFIFEGINLPFDDANNDGYIAFKIKTKSNLVVGNTFSNNANIYFDYNFPITTNTFTTTIAALKVTDFDFGSHFTLYPNPVKDVLNFQSKDDTTINSIEIYNTLGQIVLAVPNAVSTVDVSSLQSGNYFVKVNTDLGVSNTKFIKE